jgi:hypothetical protein
LLVGGSTFAQHRVAFLLGAVVVFCLPAAAWYVAIQLDWALPPSGSSPQGLLLGTTAAAIIAVEMLLWPRKKLRGRRLGRTRTWMFFHVWLGVACLPLAVGHAGFRFGGLLPATVMILCLAVIFSGVWGLALQQRLPHKLLHDFPDETIEAETDRVMAYDLPEAERLVETAGPGDVLRSFYRDAVAPYLAHGPRSKSPTGRPGSRLRPKRSAGSAKCATAAAGTTSRRASTGGCTTGWPSMSPCRSPCAFCWSSTSSRP